MQHIKICITGGAGFIGSHFAKLLRRKMGNNITVIVYDKLTYASDINRLNGTEVTIVEGDICSKSQFTEMLKRYEITHIVHFAAESHVDRSLKDVMPFVETNILGTSNIIECAAKFWLDTPEGFKGKKFIHISTDEVYGSILEDEKPADELSVLNPSNPYAATKAAADQLVIGKMNSEGFPALILRSSNVFGELQHPEKFIPKTLKSIKENTPIIVYGEGAQMRRWISVKTYSEIIWQLLNNPLVGEIINVPGEERFTNLELVCEMRQIYLKENKRESPEIQFIKDRLSHDFYYNISGEKLENWLLSNAINIQYGKMADFLLQEVKKG